MPRHAGGFVKKFDGERDAAAARLRAQGKTYREIADALGWKSHAGAQRAVQRAYAAVVAPAVEELRAAELMRLDAIDRKLLDALFENPMYAHGASGALARGPDGEPYPDQTAMNSTASQLRGNSERRAKLLGLDEPRKTHLEVEGTIRVEQTLVSDALEYLERSTPERAFYFLMSRLGVDFHKQLPTVHNPMELTTDEGAMLDMAIANNRRDAAELIIARARERNSTLSPALAGIIDRLGREAESESKALAIPGVVEEPEAPEGPDNSAPNGSGPTERRPFELGDHGDDHGEDF